MDKEQGLLDQLQKIVGCEYLSSLRSMEYREDILKAIGDFPVSDYPYREWSDALYYIFGDKIVIETYEEVKFFIERKLEEAEGSEPEKAGKKDD